jgi:hypothetical protein
MPVRFNFSLIKINKFFCFLVSIEQNLNSYRSI